MSTDPYKLDENKGSPPVPHVANGDPGDEGVLREQAPRKNLDEADLKQAQEALNNADNIGHDAYDQFDMDSLRGNPRFPEDAENEAAGKDGSE